MILPTPTVPIPAIPTAVNPACVSCGSQARFFHQENQCHYCEPCLKLHLLEKMLATTVRTRSRASLISTPKTP